jgi:hypothetical protein
MSPSHSLREAHMFIVMVGVLLFIGMLARGIWVVYYGLTRYPVARRLREFVQ